MQLCSIGSANQQPRRALMDESTVQGQIDGLTFLLAEILASMPPDQAAEILQNARRHMMQSEPGYTEGWKGIHEVVKTTLPA
jgi:hypothetical protein